MSSVRFVESDAEEAALDYLGDLGWKISHGPDISPGSNTSERFDHTEVVLGERLRNALDRLNPLLPKAAIEDAYSKLMQPLGTTLETRNREFHRMLVEGVTVEYPLKDSTRGAQATLVDFEQSSENDFLAVNQFTVVENNRERRPDILLFLNGLSVGVIELKNPADENATIWSAWQQLQTYKIELQTLFSMNEFLVVSEGINARIGTLTSGHEWFKPW